MKITFGFIVGNIAKISCYTVLFGGLVHYGFEAFISCFLSELRLVTENPLPSACLPCPTLSKSWRWLLGTISCWGSCAI